jgi:hypothetical protein
MVDWMARNYMPRPGYEDAQIVDVAEEFVHLLALRRVERSEKDSGLKHKTWAMSRLMFSRVRWVLSVDWMARNYMPRPGYEDAQIVDVAEEFVHLLVILHPVNHAKAVRNGSKNSAGITSD